MKETGKHITQPSRQSRKGFISAWFLSVFLSLCMYSAVLAENVRNRSISIMNLQREQEYFMAEYPRVREIMCRLQQERTDAGTEEEGELDEAERRTEIEPVITVEIDAPYPETLLLEVDPETRKVTDCTALRREPEGTP